MDEFDRLLARQFTPKAINRPLMNQLFTGCTDDVKAVGKRLLATGWRFYVVDQKRGRCYYAERVITVPAWIFDPSHVCGTVVYGGFMTRDEFKPHHMALYKQWYLCHEIAHALHFTSGHWSRKHAPHGDEFMMHLKQVCPIDSLIFEVSYNPRAAQRNGIGKSAGDMFMEELGF